MSPTESNGGHWSTIPVSRFARKPVLVDENVSLQEAISTLQVWKAHCLLTSGADKKVSGMFTDAELLRVVADKTPGSEPVCGYTRKDVFSIHKDSNMSQVMDLMGQNALVYLPVVDDEEKPVGVVSVNNLIDFLVDKVLPAKGDGDSYEHAMETVLHLPAAFAISAYGKNNPLRFSIHHEITDALQQFTHDDLGGALVYDEGRLAGLLRLRDIPFNILFQNDQMDNMPVSDFMIAPPETVEENDTVGQALLRLTRSRFFFVAYRMPNDMLGMIRGRGIMSYVYEHVHEDE